MFPVDAALCRHSVLCFPVPFLSALPAQSICSAGGDAGSNVVVFVHVVSLHTKK
ncbi:hypothetical protein PR003_g1349 [Phytophthora rubi]|uniref:Uncharacterized protein n=1 Tax=Phytophthora rubi TaxID=129364 RepID=A0A6A4FVM0_9STRA|nr:hypothetical protein PR002_g1315 [Phytophthora rubi]KAE9051677.1 hypothetical protein PR001_g1224 [Phytophthora rubi]KAE9358328.1 hypothetical protein PR003_g1349 [Phytophthora rubi]